MLPARLPGLALPDSTPVRCSGELPRDLGLDAPARTPHGPAATPEVVSAIQQTFRTLDEYSQQLAKGAPLWCKKSNTSATRALGLAEFRPALFLFLAVEWGRGRTIHVGPCPSRAMLKALRRHHVEHGPLRAGMRRVKDKA